MYPCGILQINFATDIFNRLCRNFVVRDSELLNLMQTEQLPDSAVILSNVRKNDEQDLALPSAICNLKNQTKNPKNVLIHMNKRSKPDSD